MCSSDLALPVSALRLAPNTFSMLAECGLRTVGQLQDLPRSSLPSRFGPQLLQRLDQATGAIDVFRRSISDATTFLGWLTPAMPFRNTVTRSVRGRLVGALATGNSVCSSAGRVDSPSCSSAAACSAVSDGRSGGVAGGSGGRREPGKQGDDAGGGGGDGGAGEFYVGRI